jgi:anti-sigma factor ChrR (cupin superfamily)
MKDKYIKTAEIKWQKIQKDVFEKQCIVNKKGLNIFILKIEPDKQIPLHEHADTRYNFILKGSVADENQKYGKGDIVINKKGSKHFLKAGPRGCEFILIWD